MGPFRLSTPVAQLRLLPLLLLRLSGSASVELGEGTIVCRGLPESRDYLRFRQDKTFWYLIGVESPNANLVIDVKSVLPRKAPRGWDCG